MIAFSKSVIRWLRLDDEQGVTAIEYGLLATLIAVAIILAATTLGTDIAAMFTAISTAITGI